MSDDLAVTVTIGLPGSGKSTWACEQIPQRSPGEVVRVNRDLLRRMLHDGRFAGTTTEDQVIAVESAAIQVAFAAGARNVIIDDTNLRPAILHRWFTLARSLDAGFVVRSFLDVPLETCIERDAQRPALTRLGPAKIRQIHDEWFVPALTCVKLIAHGHDPFEPAVPRKKG